MAHRISGKGPNRVEDHDDLAICIVDPITYQQILIFPYINPRPAGPRIA